MDSDIVFSNEPLFYSSYLAIASNNTPPDIDNETLTLLKNRSFTKYIIEHEDAILSVKMLSYVMSHSILKPQRLLQDHEDYYIAVDMFTNTYYICYRDLMMIDVDRYKNGDTLESIKVKLSKYPELFFRIYASRNGYHIFVLNRSMNYKSDESIRLMSELGCDFYYIVYSYLRGWCVRLNKKRGEEKINKLYAWIGDVVRGHFFSSNLVNNTAISTEKVEINPNLLESILPDNRLEALTDLHIDLVEVFENTGLCSMPAPN